MKILILYMPVLHKGYLELFDCVKPDIIGLLAEDVLHALPDNLAYIAKKDVIRALPSKTMCDIVPSLFPSGICVEQISIKDLESAFIGMRVLMPDEDVSVAVVEKYFEGVRAVTLVTPPSRLRYHRNNVEEKKLLVPDRRIALTALDREMMTLATNTAEHSPDWWRQVGGVLKTKEGRHIVAYNEHQPHEQIAATFGDPRSIFKSGIRTDLSFGDHAEHVLIGEAARQGISTAGANMYLTTFPCLTCSRLIARAGITRLFYRDPSYGLLDADAYLHSKKMELIEVSAEN
ncbi:MAG: deaminase [bacterium]|nr:deaminase [bacterium]